MTHWTGFAGTGLTPPKDTPSSSGSADTLRGVMTTMRALVNQPLVDQASLTVTSILSGPPAGSPPAPREVVPAPTLAGVNGKLGALYSVTDVDAPPTAVQLAETATAERELAAVGKRWEATKTGELARLNTALDAAHQPVIKPELRPALREGSGDEE